jgi:hypothetical protein
VSERGIKLMTKASRQLDEIAEFFGTLDEADLRKPCPDEGAGDTVGAAAAHVAEGYHHLGRFLQATGYVPWSPSTGNSHGRDHGHERAKSAPVPEAVPDVLDRLTSGQAPIGACWRTSPTSSSTACLRRSAGSPTGAGPSSR